MLLFIIQKQKYINKTKTKIFSVRLTLIDETKIINRPTFNIKSKEYK